MEDSWWQIWWQKGDFGGLQGTLTSLCISNLLIHIVTRPFESLSLRQSLQPFSPILALWWQLSDSACL